METSSSSSSSTEYLISSSSGSEISSAARWVQANNYRFGGYQLPLLTLDATGPAYYKVSPHPYYSNQPASWQKNAFRGIMPIK
jgi:hypothetical protein